jgi:hypothetical protein
MFTVMYTHRHTPTHPPTHPYTHPYTTPSAVRQALDRLVALNNLAACARYTEKLRRELVADVPSIFQDDPPTQQLMVRACVWTDGLVGGWVGGSEKGVSCAVRRIWPSIQSTLLDGATFHYLWSALYSNVLS